MCSEMDVVTWWLKFKNLNDIFGDNFPKQIFPHRAPLSSVQNQPVIIVYLSPPLWLKLHRLLKLSYRYAATARKCNGIKT